MPNDLLRDPVDWVNGRAILQSELDALDGDLAAVVNGDDGGAYTQTGTLAIAGAGVWLAASLNHQLSGTGTTLAPAAGSKSLTHGDNDYIQLASTHIGTSRSLLTPCQRGITQAWARDSTTGSLVSPAPGASFVLPLRVHHAAVLTSASLRFRIVSSHLPAVLPKLRILRVDTAGTVVVLSNGDVDGFVPFAPRPANGAAWYASGAVQTITASAMSEVIDVSRYVYLAQVVDESGSGAIAGNIYGDIQAFFTGIADLRPQ